MSTVLAAALAGTLVLLAVRPPGRPAATGPRPAAPASPEPAALLRWRPVVAGLAAVGGYLVLGGPVGAGAGLVAGWASWRVLGRAESPASVLRREQLARDLPTGVDLLACCVQSGAAVEAALVTVADALGGPLAEELRGVHHRLALGVDPISAWRGLGAVELQPLVRAVLRAHESGAAVSDAVARLADDLREQARSEVLARAGAVEVRAAAPLGACFLPAFVLVGVVPLVAGTFTALSPFG